MPVLNHAARTGSEWQAPDFLNPPRQRRWRTLISNLFRWRNFKVAGHLIEGFGLSQDGAGRMQL